MYSELKFEEHISNKVKKANSMVGLIKRSFSYLSPEMFKILYTTFVKPHLEYAQIVWSPKLFKYVNLIESVQRRATKMVRVYQNLPYEERLRLIDIPTLNIRRKIGDMVEVYRHLHVYDKSSVSNKFVPRFRPNKKA